jgi:two-component system, OmpR family, phosphate regulon response regulator PhoB
VTNTFSPRELVARVGAVLRRVRPALAGGHLRFADLEMDLAAHKVRRGGRAVALGPTEFRLLRHFLEHPGRVFSRERLLDAVWPHDAEIEARTVDVHIRRLRKALNEGGGKDIVRTVRSAGYSLDEGGDD